MKNEDTEQNDSYNKDIGEENKPVNPSKKRRTRKPRKPKYVNCSWEGMYRCTSEKSCGPGGCGKPVNLRNKNGRSTPIHIRPLS